MKALVLAVSLLVIGSAPLLSQEPSLDFLKNIPELRDLTLKTSETQLKERVEKQGLYAKKTLQDDRLTYKVVTPAGENIIVGFQDGKCTGIQRMQPIPPSMIQEDIGKAEYQEWMAKRGKAPSK